MNCKSFYGSKKQQQWVTHRLRIPPTNLSEESDLLSDTDEEIFFSSTIESETDEEILKEPSDSDTNDDYSINTTSPASDLSIMEVMIKVTFCIQLMMFLKQDPDKVEKITLDFETIQSDDEDMKNWEPIEFYKKFLNNSIFELIVEESNRYAIQCNPSSPLNLSCNELEQFIGILYAMSLVKMPSTRLYWSKEFYFEKVAGTMPVNRFEKIKKFLHCSDNLTRPKNCTDRLYKIRPLVDHLQKQFSNLKPSELLCIDEQIVPFKGKSGLKQYNPKKPKKWGYKLYVLSGIDGLIYNFQVYTGAIDVCLN